MPKRSPIKKITIATTADLWRVVALRYLDNVVPQLPTNTARAFILK